MKTAPEMLLPVLDLMDGLISEYGLYLFMGFTVFCLVIIAWVLSGGLRPKDGSADCGVSVGLIIYPSNGPSEPPPIDCESTFEPPRERNCDD
jgi:hypothetical protein